MAVVALPVRSLTRARARLLVGVYTTAVFVGASLVFLVEPLTAKLVLPVFGGTSAVWITALVFFQAVLLLGYLYAHVSTRLLGRRQPLVHALVLLLALGALPIALPHNAAPSASGSPALWLLFVLALTVGAPFFAVTAASPTLQRWFSQTSHGTAGDPYFLYAASNVGSLLALVAYPLLVEPNLTLSEQTRLWRGGYIVFVGLSAACAFLAWSARRDAPTVHAPAVASPSLSWRLRGRWVLLAFIPSSLLVGATNYISTDIAPIPLFWIVPLAVYLLTFALAFSRRPLLSPAAARAVLPFCVVAYALAVPGLFSPPVWMPLLVQPALLFVAAMLAHGTLSAERPPADRLTEFFLLLAVGGVLGSVFNALIAPLVFDTLLEYPLVIALALLLRATWPTGDRRVLQVARQVAIGCAAAVTPLVGALALGVPARYAIAAIAIGLLGFYRRPVIFAFGIGLVIVLMAGRSGMLVERTFYGVLQVRDQAGLHILNNGTTIHGLEWTNGPLRDVPLGYYTRSGPIGQAFAELEQARPFHDVGVVGLGVGALAAYGRTGQHFTFFEIDPADVAIAQNPRYFTFLHDSRASVSVVEGDGRLSLQHVPDGSYDLLVLDAFSSDAIPVHLLTREAVSLELSKLRPGGALAFHVSNRYLRLEPVLSAVARDLHLAGVAELDLKVSAAQRHLGKTTSHWIVLARHPADIAPLLHDARWHRLAPTSERAWTDDYSNVAGAIDWTG